MNLKKLTVIVAVGALMMAGAMGISMKLTQQREMEMEVANLPKKAEEEPETGETRVLGNMENIPLYYDDEKKLLLPLRNVIEGLGGSVEWERETRLATVACMGRTLALFPGKEEASLNGYAVTLPEPAEMINGSLYIDSGWLTDYFNMEVIWNNESRQVTLKTGDLAVPTAAFLRMEGRKGGRAYCIDAPVVVGLNDGKFEKSLNAALEGEMRALGAAYLEEPEKTEGRFVLKARTALLAKDFLSFCWEGERDGLPDRQAKNIDLRGQKEIALSELLAADSVAMLETALGDAWRDGGFFLSRTEGLVLLTEDASGGVQAYPWPEEETLRWKTNFRELAKE